MTGFYAFWFAWYATHAATAGALVTLTARYAAARVRGVFTGADAVGKPERAGDAPRQEQSGMRIGPLPDRADQLARPDVELRHRARATGARRRQDRIRRDGEDAAQASRASRDRARRRRRPERLGCIAPPRNARKTAMPCGRASFEFLADVAAREDRQTLACAARRSRSRRGGCARRPRDRRRSRSRRRRSAAA